MKGVTPKAKQQFRNNLRLARHLWPNHIHRVQAEGLEELSVRYFFSVAVGDLQFLDGRWYVTHAGLLRLAHRNHCHGIRVQQIREFCEPALARWVFKATVYKSPRSRGFVSYGDADPSNVSSLVHGAEMRVAETRAVNRALRKAYGIGLCSVEELGALPRRPESPSEKQDRSPSSQVTCSGNGHPRLRDQLCLLIRKHQLDAALVKLYAAEFCGTTALRDASREKVESFITHLADWAARDRDALLCKLNSYTQPQEV